MHVITHVINIFICLDLFFILFNYFLLPHTVMGKIIIQKNGRVLLASFPFTQQHTDALKCLVLQGNEWGGEGKGKGKQKKNTH